MFVRFSWRRSRHSRCVGASKAANPTGEAKKKKLSWLLSFLCTDNDSRSTGARTRSTKSTHTDFHVQLSCRVCCSRDETVLFLLFCPSNGLAARANRRRMFERAGERANGRTSDRPTEDRLAENISSELNSKFIHLFDQRRSIVARSASGGQTEGQQGDLPHDDRHAYNSPAQANAGATSVTHIVSVARATTTTKATPINQLAYVNASAHL